MNMNTQFSEENSALRRGFLRVQCQSQFLAHLNSLQQESVVAIENLEQEQAGKNYVFNFYVNKKKTTFVEFKRLLTSAVACKNHFKDPEFQHLPAKQFRQLEEEVDQRVKRLIELIESHDELVILENDGLARIMEYIQIGNSKLKVAYWNYMRVCYSQQKEPITIPNLPASMTAEILSVFNSGFDIN